MMTMRVTVAAVLLGGFACSGTIDHGSSDRRPGGGAAGAGFFAGAGGAAGNSAGFAGAGGAAGGAGNVAPGDTALPSATLRRLTPVQYKNAVRELLGVELDVSALTTISPLSGLQAIGASTVSLAEVDLEAFERFANDAAEQAFSDNAARMRIAGCDATQAACADGFIASFGRRAFRRPLSADERTRYGALKDQALTMTSDAWLSLRVVTSAFLQSPAFLYREELGAPDGGNGRLLDDYAVASRLSFFIANTPPDALLLDAAASGALATDAGLRAQADRLMRSAGASLAVDELLTDYLRLDALDSLAKLTDVYPDATPTLPSAMKEETLRTLGAQLFERGGDFRQAFTSTTTFVNEELAELYDVPAPDGSALVEIELPGSGPRAGLLTHASFLATHAHPARTSPTKRGKFIREAILCQAIPAPPPNVDTSLPDTSDAATLREKLTEHRENPTCAGCHTLMDPIGLALEHFDGLGAFREMENGETIDASGELDGTTFTDARGLGAALAAHPELVSCFARTLYRYARGTLETDAEEPQIEALTAAFASAGYKVPELMLHIASEPTFRRVGELP
jgi:hypothetical protein